MRSVFKYPIKWTHEMPTCLFWGGLLLLTWHILFKDITSFDLWWHLACGRYLLENGVYPPTGTFTFSPVLPTTPNIHTWLGDIFLYMVYWAGKEPGLLIFRVILVGLSVYLTARMAKRRYNLWLMAVMVLMIIGTIQTQTLRNSMFALGFLPLMIWLWCFIKQRGDLKTYFLVFLYVPMMGVWSIMHGYALVGAYIVMIIFVGELIDLVIRKEKGRWKKAVVFFVSVVCMGAVVNQTLPLRLGSQISSLLNVVIPSNTSVEMEASPPSQSAGEKFSSEQTETGTGLGAFIKKASRFLLQGGDVGFIGEYNYPFDYPDLMFVKALKWFIPAFIFYLIIAVWLSPGHLRFSFILPSLATLFIGIGYFRTLGFPFLVAAPFMAYGITELRDAIGKKTFSPPVKTIGRFCMFIPAIALGIFCFNAHYALLKGNYYGFSGLDMGEPGVDVGDRYRSKIPQYVLDRYLDEDMFNSYNTGSWLIWEWYGKKKVFIDGRSITYQPNFYNDFRYNMSFEYLERMDIRHAILGVYDDFNWFEPYLKLYWDIEAFDTGMLLLKRRVKTGYDVFYGNVPQFIGSPEDVDQLQQFSKERFGYFLNVIFKYMLIFGRLEDGLKFYDQIEAVIERLGPGEMRDNLQAKKAFMDDMVKDFGPENRVELVEVFREVLLTDRQDREDVGLSPEKNPVSVNIAFANAHFKLGNMRKGVDYLSIAADQDVENVPLQVEVGDYFFKLKAVGPAIKHYERAVRLEPDRVHEFNKLGALYFQKGDQAAAEDNFKRAIQADPTVIASYINLAAIYLAEDQPELSRQTIARGLALDPENVDLKDLEKTIDQK